VQNWLLAAIEADDTLSPQERCDAGSALNWIGDPRFNPQKFFLSNDENMGFVEIPAGSFLMGSDKNKDNDADEDEFPQHTVELSTFAISRYPVTVAQFRSFVEDSNYDAGGDWQNGQDNHPVVDVNWHNAMAYCQWLTEKLDTGNIITLPTEAQWEKAARGTDGRIYPWGDKPDANRANYNDTGIGATSSVGCFSGGNSKYGVIDMSGNVWEWTHSLWGKNLSNPDFVYPYDPVDGREDIKSGSYRVLRGGAWCYNAGICRSALRYDGPGKQYSLYGFRLASCRLPNKK